MFGFEQFFGSGFGGSHQQFHGGSGGAAAADDDDDGSSNDTNKFYEVLGIEKKASQPEIKKAYRKKARDLHPDRHPNEKEKYEKLFQEVQAAYEVLSDPDKRKLYDRYGESGLKGGGSSSHMSDIFDAFFGGGGGGGRGGGRRQRKAPPIKKPLDVTLGDLYIGATKTIKFDRLRTCTTCDGKGGNKVISCNQCNGTGHQTIVQRMGNMTMRTQRSCSSCGGEGQTVREKDKCKSCNGKGMIEKKQELDVHISPGAKHADQIQLRNQGHEIPDVAIGDVLIILRCEKHPIFRRVGADLAINQKISLKQALCGYTIKIPHLSRSVLLLQSKPDEITQHDQLKCIYTWGMPQKGATNVKGNLYVKFEVKFPSPDELSNELLQNISQLLPDDSSETDIKMEQLIRQGSSDDNDDPYEEHVTAETIQGEPDVTPASSRSQYDEDDEQEGGVQCRQM